MAPCTEVLVVCTDRAVVDRRGGTGEIVISVDLDIEREGHVMPHQLEVRVVEALGDIVLVP